MARAPIEITPDVAIALGNRTGGPMDSLIAGITPAVIAVAGAPADASSPTSFATLMPGDAAKARPLLVQSCTPHDTLQGEQHQHSTFTEPPATVPHLGHTCPLSASTMSTTMTMSIASQQQKHQAVVDPSLIHLAIAKAQRPERHGAGKKGAHGRPDSATDVTDKIKLGICCMKKKLNSPTMDAMLERFEAFGNFHVVRFEEAMLLNEHPSCWPTVDVMIAFFSSGFPLEKAVAYADLHPHIFFITEPRNQRVLLDRRDVYSALRLNNIPHPKVVFCNRDGYKGLPESIFEEFDDYIVVDGQRMDKPFVEKPVSAEDHRVQVYYKGGGMRKLFRKVGNKSSDLCPEVSAVRRDGSYIYEEFIETEGTRDIKCYTVGPGYVFAETRKAPTGDGVVLRREDGKEMREPITLRGAEIMAARKLIKVFRQIVCGFDILRRADGKFFVCDVNGWSFVKNVPEYVDRATAIMRDIFVEEVRKRGLHREFRNKTMTRNLLGVVGVMRHADRTPKQKVKIVVNVEPLLLAAFDGERKVKDEIVFKSGHPKLEAIYEVVCALLSSTPASVCSEGDGGDSQDRGGEHIRGTITPVASLSGCGCLAMAHAADAAQSAEGYALRSPPTTSLGAPLGVSPMMPLPSGLNTSATPNKHDSSETSNPQPQQQQQRGVIKSATSASCSPSLLPNHDSFMGEANFSLMSAKREGGGSGDQPQLGNVLSAPSSLNNAAPLASVLPSPRPLLQPISAATVHSATGSASAIRAHAAACTTPAPAPVAFSVRTGDNISTSVMASLRLMRDVLARQHEGLKVQVKPRQWDDEGNCIEALLVCKWGGWLTEAGYKQSQMMGRHFLKRIFGVNELTSIQKSKYVVQTNNERRVVHTAVEFSSAMLGEPYDEKRCIVNENLLGKTLGAKAHMSAFADKIKAIFNAKGTATELAHYIDMPGMRNIVENPAVPDDKRTPRGALETLHGHIEALCQSFAHSSTSAVQLYRDEPMALLRQRWTNLRNALYQKKTDTFDTTKVPDIFDNISYDVCYNQRAFKDQLDMYPLFSLAEAMSTFVSDGEFGTTAQEKRTSATLFATPLLEKITEDLRQIAQKQGPTMRMYFTSESHVTGLKNLLYTSSEPFLRMEEPMELHFLSHFVFKLYRYPDAEADKQYQIEVHFSMGMDKNMFGIVQEHHVDYASVTPMIRIHNNLDLERLHSISTQFVSEANTASSSPGTTPYGDPTDDVPTGEGDADAGAATEETKVASPKKEKKDKKEKKKKEDSDDD